MAKIHDLYVNKPLTKDHTLTVTFDIHYTTTYRLRSFVGRMLMRLACECFGCKVEFESNGNNRS